MLRQCPRHEAAAAAAAAPVGPSSLDSREIFPTSVFRFVCPPLRLRSSPLS